MKRIKLQLFAIEIAALILLLTVSILFFDRLLDLSEENRQIYLRNSLTQAAQGVEVILDDIESSVRIYSYSEEIQSLLREPRLSMGMLSSFNTARRAASTVVSINQNIAGIAILPPEGLYYNFGLLDQYSYLNSMRDLLSSQRTPAFNGTLDAFGRSSAYFTYSMPIYATAQSADTALGQYLGTAVAFCKKDALYQVVDAALLDNMSIELHEPGGRIFQRAQGLSGDRPALTVNTYEIPCSGWTLIQRDYNAAYASPYPIFFAVCLLLSLGVLVTLSFFIHRNFSLPITQINSGLLRIAERPLEPAALTLHCNNELNTIAHSVNTLLEHLQRSHHIQVEQESHLLRQQLSMNQLQLMLLQNQINPHFLYNTLACIRGIALSHDVPVIAQIVTDMAALYRYSIKGGAYAQLRDELDIVRRYMDIMNRRTDNRFRVEIDIPQRLQDNWLAKMILQPLAENAVFHGLEGKEGDGLLRIYVSYFENDTAFLLHVWDNGVGMDEETVRALNDRFNQPVDARHADESSTNSMGLLNVHRKICLHHGEAFGLHAESVKGQFTRMSVLLPLLTHKPKT